MKRVTAGAAVVAAGAVFVAIGQASSSSGPVLSGVPSADRRADGYAPATRLSPELAQIAWAQGATRLENPQGIIDFYGYETDVPQMLPTPGHPDEATKTEPDKNTYLVFQRGRHGPDAGYDYGTHFLYQGHENAADGMGYVTRINLDADADHRVTLLAAKDTDDNKLATIDGSTWDPWAQRLIFTTEDEDAPTYAATADYPSTVEDVSGALGRGGYEGVQDDSAGNLWLVEDGSGAGKAGTTAKRPNSFVYRYVPRRRGDLRNGRLEVLQVRNASGQPITFESQSALDAPDQVALHSYGNVLTTEWVVVHDTATDGTAPFNANDAAKAAHGTPFKRPENGVFRPGSKFTEFYFDETGDTNATSPENDHAGGWSTIQKLTQTSPAADTGKLTVFYLGDEDHAGLDNSAFLSRDKVTFAEDAGDTLHGQRDALDSGFVFDVRADYSDPHVQPVRWIAEGRDASATIDAANGGFGKNDGDNELTGVHVSDGDPGAGGILGARVPKLFAGGWRWFYTQQHGDNPTYEIIPASSRGDD
jgi:hypothetical protein